MARKISLRVRSEFGYGRPHQFYMTVSSTAKGARAPDPQAIIGCLLGTAVGDAVGLPLEALSKRRQERLFPEVTGPNLFFGRGMLSDDTEHTCMVAQALLVSGGEPQRFIQSLAWRLRCWLLGLPAGVGLATLRAAVKLWVGFSPDHSGVFSAGNGPAMRSAILGVCYGDQIDKLRALTHASTCLTHVDPRAEHGALAVALAAWFAAKGNCDPCGYCRELQKLLGNDGSELINSLFNAADSANRGERTEEFAVALGLANGVSGYVNHTVPVALHTWFRYSNDYRAAVLAAIRCGGDTDTVAAIAGGIVGAGVGRSGIPQEWLNALCDWPRTVSWIEKLGQRLAQMCFDETPRAALGLPFYGVPLRNAFFAAVVLAHGLRRLLPPY